MKIRIILTALSFLVIGSLQADSQLDRQMRKLWEDGVKSQMKPGAEEFIKAVKARKHAWVQAKIEKGVDPNAMFHGDYSISKIIFPIHYAITNGDIKMFDILGPSSNYDCVTITYVIGLGVDKSKDCRDILYTLLFSALIDEAGKTLLKHALENFRRIRQGIDGPGLGFSQATLTVRQNWKALTESFCDRPESAIDRKTCADYRAVLEMLNAFVPETAATPDVDQQNEKQ